MLALLLLGLRRRLAAARPATSRRGVARAGAASRRGAGPRERARDRGRPSTCSADADAASPGPTATGSPSDWRFPPRTTPFAYEDAGEAGVIVTGRHLDRRSATSWTTSTTTPSTPGSGSPTGETEEHDAEANWAAGQQRRPVDDPRVRDLSRVRPSSRCWPTRQDEGVSTDAPDPPAVPTEPVRHRPSAAVRDRPRRRPRRHRCRARGAGPRSTGAGVFGHRPVVPVEPAALEAARPAPDEPAGVVVRRRRRRPAAHRAGPTGRRSAGTGSCRGCSSTSSSGTPRSSCSGAGCPRRCCSRRSACWRWRTATPSTRSPGRRARSGCRWCSRPRARCRWRRSPRTLGRLARAGSSSTGASDDDARRLVRRPRRGDRLRGDRGHPRHARARLAHPRPRPGLPAVRPRRGHRAVHQRPGASGRSPRSGPRPGRGAVPASRRRGRPPAAVRALLSMARH